jgi:Protein of unknown function (DUF998)
MGLQMTVPRPSPTRLGLAGLGTFVGLVVVQHATRAGDLPPAEHFISEYSRGAGGQVQVVAFGAWAVSLGATATVVARRRAVFGRRIARGLAVLGLGVGTAGALLCASFATETVGGKLPAGAIKSTAGQLHDLGSGLILLGVLVAAVATLRLPVSRAFRLTVLGLAALLLLIPAALVTAGYDAPGWGQRGVIGVGCLWQAAILRELRD